MKYFYGMRLRGFSPGCQPEGAIERIDSEEYHDIIVYDRLLLDEEVKHFSLTPLKLKDGKYVPIVTISEYIKNNKKPVKINGITFRLYDVNMYDLADIEKKTNYEEGTDLSFLERLERAIEELEQITKGMTLEEAKTYFRDNTEDGNSNYYGGMCFVYTADMPKSYIMFGVRMD